MEMRFHIKERAWSLPEPFIVSDDAGSAVFEVRGTFSTIDDDLVLIDRATGQELARAHIRQHPLLLTLHYEIYRNGQLWFNMLDRFLKQDLLWTQAHLRTPEQVERWSWIVACACNQLLLCQHFGQAVLRPWESKERAVTPRQVRRAMPSILVQVGTPARHPKPRGKSPGWPKGRARTPAPRFVVVRKPKPVPKTRHKRA